MQSENLLEMKEGKLRETMEILREILKNKTILSGRVIIHLSEMQSLVTGPHYSLVARNPTCLTNSPGHLPNRSITGFTYSVPGHELALYLSLTLGSIPSSSSLPLCLERLGARSVCCFASSVLFSREIVL